MPGRVSERSGKKATWEVVLLNKKIWMQGACRKGQLLDGGGVAHDQDEGFAAVSSAGARAGVRARAGCTPLAHPSGHPACGLSSQAAYLAMLLWLQALGTWSTCNLFSIS